jgi:uncharacterized repeat protein (TIGR03803 family)
MSEKPRAAQFLCIVNASRKMSWRKRTCTVCAAFAATAMALPAQTFTTLHSFDGTDGYFPEVAVLVQGIDGNLYATVPDGGTNGDGGTVFKITPSATFTTIYNFCLQSGCTDGAFPDAGLVQATNGDFYGTTGEGGANGGANCAPDGGCGTVFKITASGDLTTLYGFCAKSGCTDGRLPIGTLVNATNGNFYGTTNEGGVSTCAVSGLSCGTVFKITPSGKLTTLHSFDGTDGVWPEAGLVQATNGDFYGTTSYAGANGWGTVFKITPSGTLTTLHSFGGADGAQPSAGLVQATNGDLYGTTWQGGSSNPAGCYGRGCGTVFKITPSGTLTTLYSFCSESGCADGELPLAGLVQATNGDFYGTTSSGGANGGGTVFRITPRGKLTTLYSFCSQGGNQCTDGYRPQAGLAQATNGDFYGTTFDGGANGHGTIFSLSVGLGPFVETQPTSGKVGAAIQILGTDLTGATTVAFNGTSAAFTVVSPNLNTTTVPTGATAGTVQVMTPSGTLLSNVPFRVLP